MENGIFARKSEYLDCYVQIGIASGRVINVSFPSSPDENSEENGPLLDDIFSYLEGKRMDFTDIDVGLTISGDERRLLEKTREIPYGEQISVRQLVQMVSTLDSDSDD
ncbi:MAG: methylated-DNA--[protein]-cysteine S-methyltransferase, partial [Halobacteriaceae archaeon]